MIDLILWAADKPSLAQWAKARGLIIRTGDVIDQDPDSPTFGDVLVAGEWSNRDGFEYCWWADSGKMMTKAGTYGAEGAELTAPSYLAGVLAFIRISGEFFTSDRIIPDDADPDKLEQFARSKVVRYLKNNGTIGTLAGGALKYVEFDGVRIFRPNDVQALLASKNLPGHSWLGGNAY